MQKADSLSPDETVRILDSMRAFLSNSDESAESALASRAISLFNIDVLQFFTSALKISQHPEIQYEVLRCLTNLSLSF